MQCLLPPVLPRVWAGVVWEEDRQGRGVHSQVRKPRFTYTTHTTTTTHSSERCYDTRVMNEEVLRERSRPNVCVVVSIPCVCVCVLCACRTYHGPSLIRKLVSCYSLYSSFFSSSSHLVSSPFLVCLPLPPFPPRPSLLFSQRYLPQLRKFPKKYIYEPHLAPLSVQKECGCVSYTEY